MRVVIFSGTTEGRELSVETAALGMETLVCVATEYGKEVQTQEPGIQVHSGRLDVEGMTQVLAGADLCVDATHPYAREASRNIREAAKEAGVPCHRLLRRESQLPPGCILVDSAADAARFLQGVEGNILLTTGAKELASFAPVGVHRLYPRVLPAVESLEACEALGISRSNVIAMQGPFTQELNVALIRQFSIGWLVTKDGGAAGGFAEKVRAAQEAGAKLVVIRRPKEDGESFETILQLCKEMMGCR